MTLPQEISSRLLLDQPPELDVDQLIAALNSVMAPSSMVFQRQETDQGILITTGGLHLRIGARATPLPRAHFDTALDSGLDRMRFEDWKTWVAGHRASVRITIASGAAGGAAQGERLSVSPQRDLFDLMLNVLHVTTSHLATEQEPIAIHWEQSDQLFSAKRFMTMADMIYPLPLFLHPRPFTSGRVHEGAGVVGFHLQGAAEIIGVPLLVHEAPVRFDWLLGRALAFVAHCRAMGELPADGTSFGLETGELIRVSHEPAGVTLTLIERDGMMVLQPDRTAATGLGAASLIKAA